MSWLCLLSTALAGGFAPVEVDVHVDVGPWTSTWSIDGQAERVGDADVSLLPGSHTLQLGDTPFDFLVYLDGSISEDVAALDSDARRQLQVEGIEVQITGVDTFQLDAAAPPVDHTVSLVPGVSYALDVGQLGHERGSGIRVHVEPDGMVHTTLTAEQATTGERSLDLLTRKLKVEPQGYGGVWWTSADPRTAQLGSKTLELVPMLPYGAAAGLRERFAFAFRVTLGGNTEVMATRGSGQVSTGKGWLRFSVGGTPNVRSPMDYLLDNAMLRPTQPCWGQQEQLAQ